MDIIESRPKHVSRQRDRERRASSIRKKPHLDRSIRSGGRFDKGSASTNLQHICPQSKW